MRESKCTLWVHRRQGCGPRGAIPPTPGMNVRAGFTHGLTGVGKQDVKLARVLVVGRDEPVHREQ